ncbi:hypothetical protein Fuma_01845 [Fuerstiella marisgermanici]|uniref:Uncharacterized protein n=1 Tax=Fuerstiella marisgermanici TaxID=1891926 RepID=A0A1P8WDS8_9PLAN|nr:hypothetical protein Fuma_01845 [Fuerstiella marisgermanici]
MNDGSTETILAGMKPEELPVTDHIDYLKDHVGFDDA